MSTLTQLLGNRELAWEDNLEKGRIWVYSDGNMYSAFCNGFCWKPPGCGKAIIEIWGASGSGAQMCCCGVGLPGNPAAYVKKCICVCPSNYVCGYVGRSCNNSSALCFRGCSEATCVCWYGCAPNPVWEGGIAPNRQESFRGNNPWGWGQGGGNPMSGDFFGSAGGGVQFEGGQCGRYGGNCSCAGWGICAAVGATNGCLCAQGGRGGISYCIDDKSPYSCFITNAWCGSKTSTQHNMCDISRSACGMICNWNPSDWPGSASFQACGYGGDINCCGGFSCVSWQGCLPMCTCMFQYHITTSPGTFANDGGSYTYTTENDSPMVNWSGSTKPHHLNGLTSLSRQPGHLVNIRCWRSDRACGCYEMEGCMHYVPYGVPGAAPHPCPGVRDHAMRGGMGMVRIKYIPTDGGNTY
jgi:hypothetical protein